MYDIDAENGDNPTKIIVFEGSALFVGGGVERTVNTGEALLLSGASRELSVGVELAATVELGGSGDARPTVMPISAGLEQLLILASGQNDIKVIGPRVDRGGRMFVHSRPCCRGG